MGTTSGRGAGTSVKVPRVRWDIRCTPTAVRPCNPDHLPERLTTSEFPIDALAARHESRGDRRMTITVTRLHPHIGAEIGGLDLREPVDAAAVSSLPHAVDPHALVALPGPTTTHTTHPPLP